MSESQCALYARALSCLKMNTTETVPDVWWAAASVTETGNNAPSILTPGSMNIELAWLNFYTPTVTIMQRLTEIRFCPTTDEGGLLQQNACSRSFYEFFAIMNTFFCEILTRCTERIRDFFENALYKLTLYLLTYLLTFL